MTPTTFRVYYDAVHLCRDEEGYVTGYSKELIDHVCRAADIDCRTVWDKFTNCWKSNPGEHSTGGKGTQCRSYMVAEAHYLKKASAVTCYG